MTTIIARAKDETDLKLVLNSLGIAEKYHAIIDELKAQVEPVLSFIPRGMPEYTDHGMRHSNNILALLIKFYHNLSTFQPFFSFSQEELFLLSASAYLHDIGCIVNREEHNKESAKLLTEHPAFCFLSDRIGADLLPCLSLIVQAHSSNFNLLGIPKGPLHEHVRLRLMCSIFRLLDACEISAARVSKTLYEILKTHNKIEDMKWWDTHLSIYNLFFLKNEIIIDCDDVEKAKLAIDHLQDDLVIINQVFIEEDFPKFTAKIIELGF